MVQENLQINIGANTQDLQQGLNQATASVTNFSNSLNRATKPTTDATNSLTNLSRIAQDAPYGFMGIANNLNPMLESFQRLQKEAGGSGAALKAMAAGLTGPAGIGVALGVVSSLIVAFGDDINDYFNKLSMGSTITTQYKDAFKAIGSEFTSAVEKVDKMQIAFNQYHAGLITGDAALKLYNDTLGKNFGAKSKINEAEDEFIKKKDAYVEASLQRALADAAGKKAAEELLKQKVLERAPDKTGEFGKIIVGELSKSLLSPLLQKFITDKLVNIYDVDKTEKDITKAKDLISNYKKIQEDAKNLEAQKLKESGITLDPEKDKKGLSTSIKAPKIEREKVDDSYLETLKLRQKLNKDDVYMYKDYADLIVAEELKIALKRAEINKASANEIENIKEQSNIKLEQNQVDLGNALDRLFAAEDKKWLAEQKEANKLKEEEEKRAAKERLQAEKERQRDLEELQKQHEKFAQIISQDVTEALFTMYDAMQQGESPLKALGDYLAHLAEKFAAAIVQATIFKGIMSLLENVTGGGGFFGSIFSGVGKLLGFADGGIVSSPTMAMVGEGGQSEAIMPLSKLGNMMNSTFAAGAMSGGNVGGGNGQFVLKGNDLVLALQRSNYSLNLRRGA